VVYARRAVSRDRWESTTLKDLGVDGKDGAGVLLTLNLPSGVGTVAASSTAAASNAASSTSTAVSAVVDDNPQPMEIDPAVSTTTSSHQTPTPNSPSAALSQILSQNFDADIVPCVLTLIKLLNNIISTNPRDDIKGRRVRCINLANAAFDSKVGRVSGGVDFLLSCGFERQQQKQLSVVSATASSSKTDCIELREEKESTEQLVEARKLLAHKAVTVLGVSGNDIPAFRDPPPRVELTSSAAAAAAATSSSRSGGNTTGTTSSKTFDPYKSHSYNAQAAAVGAPNPNSVLPTEDPTAAGGDNYVSRTERELNALKNKQERLERKMQKLGPGGRALAAFLPGSVGAVSTLRDASVGSTSSGADGGGRGDGSLLAARMKRMEEERKKREEGGFTTRAMRDLESMKKAKVYTHATLRIGFADGTWITAKFLPSETVNTVREVLIEECFRADIAPGLDFDLYVAPPRRILDRGKRLDAEGLVPAARVHVSWKVGGAPPSPPAGSGSESRPGSYLREELFGTSAQVGGADYNAAAFPDAKKLVEDKSSGKKRGAAEGANGGGGGAAASAESREDALVARMLGKKSGLLGRKGSSASSGDKKSGSGKPKWFK